MKVLPSTFINPDFSCKIAFGRYFEISIVFLSGCEHLQYTQIEQEAMNVLEKVEVIDANSA